MEFNLNYQSGILLFFFVQGLVFVGLLARQALRHQQVSSAWLAGWVFLSCLYITPWMCGHAGWYARDGYREFLFFVPFQQFFFLGPIIFFYVRALLEPGYRLSRRDWWHFVPGILYLMYSIVIVVVDTLWVDEFYFYADGRDKDLASWYQITGLAVLLYYTVQSLRRYNAYRQRIYDELSYADTVLFRWLRQFLSVLSLMVLIRLTFLVLFPDWGSFGQKWYYYVCYGTLAYFVAFRGYVHAVISAHLLPERDVVLSEGGGASTVTSSISNDHPEEREIAPIAVLEDPVDPEQKERLIALMEQEQYYRESTLTLTQLARHLGLHRKALSSLINQGFGVNFNDFVNGYRVAAFQQKIKAGDDKHLTLLGIAFACGFNSKTTFNRVYKRHTGQTPVEFLAAEKKLHKQVPNHDVVR